MTVTYLVAIEVPDPALIEDVAADIDDILTENGLPVISAVPWARPTMGEPEPLPPMF